MVNKLSEKGIAMAFASSVAIAYIICFLIVILAGNSALGFFNLFMHGIDISSLSTTPNILNGIIGIVIAFIASYLIGWIFAWIYNKSAK